MIGYLSHFSQVSSKSGCLSQDSQSNKEEGRENEDQAAFVIIYAHH